MTSSMLPGFQPSQLPVSCAAPSASFLRPNQTGSAASFSQALETASARQAQAGSNESASGPQPAQEGNSQQRSSGQTTAAAPAPPVRNGCQTGCTRKEEADRQGVADAQSATQTTGPTVKASAPQTGTAAAPDGDSPPKKEVTVTISLQDVRDDLSGLAAGLSAAVLNALLAAGKDGGSAAQLVVTMPTEKQQGGSQDSSGDISKGQASGSGQPQDSDPHFTLTLPLEGADPTQVMNQLLTLLQSLAGILQNRVSGAVDSQPGQGQTPGLNALYHALSDAPDHTVPKEAPVQTASPVSTGLGTLFKDPLSALKSPNATSTADLSGDLPGPNVVPESPAELKLPKTTETDLAESLLAKIKVAVSLPGVVEGAGSTTQHETAPSAKGGNENSGLTEQGAWVQAIISHQEPSAEASGTAPFGTIMTDRLAAIAEQVGLRDKPNDVTLRLNTDSGESLMVGLRDQAGKIVVQVRSADGNMVGFLESQKETIVRNLEAKQVSSSISVSPIEEDLARRQDREQRQRNNWGRRREAANPFTQTTI